MAKIIPLREPRMRECGRPGLLRLDGRVLCSRHWTREKNRTAVGRSETET